LKRLDNKTRIILGTLLLLSFTPLLSSLVFAENPIIFESLTLTVYYDGYVQITNIFEINQTYPQVTFDLLTPTPEDLLIEDEQGSLLDYAITETQVTVFSLGASQIKISYFTPNLTYKTGKFWTIALDVPINTTIILPENATIISLNKVPEIIESFNGQVTIIMPSGEIEVSYIAKHVLQEQPESFAILPVIIFSFLLVVVTILFLFKFLRSKKPEDPQITGKILDFDKLFDQNKHLRPEEVQVITFLGENNATAYEAQIYEKLDLPRTTTWRLLKRLQKMDIINIEKSRRQNIITVRRKYLKKNLVK